MAVVRLELFLSVMLTAPLITPFIAATAATASTPCVIDKVPEVAVKSVTTPGLTDVNVTAELLTALVEYPVKAPLYVPNAV